MDWSNYKQEEFKQDIQRQLPIDMSRLDPQEHLSQLNQIICKNMDKYIKEITVKVKHVGNFFSLKIIKLRKRRNAMYKRFKKNGSPELKKKKLRLN